jgi:hypothetical protein
MQICLFCRIRDRANTAEITPCANTIGPLEKSVRSYPETQGEHVVELSLGAFNMLDE